MPATPISTQPIRFFLNGEPVTVTDSPPTRTVLAHLREDLRCTGTKEGCAEGDCGACTVVLAEPFAEGLRTRAVNACIQFLPTLDGKAVFTVEYLRQNDGALHPVQQAMVDCHGSQCGFCTPGFVMSLWACYIAHGESGTRPDRAALRSALTGNLCRCTGYRPILEAGERMFDLPRVDFAADAVRRDLDRITRDQPLCYEQGGVRFYAPSTVQQLTELKTEYPEATVLAGCTDIGLWVNKQFRELGDILYLGEVAELKRIDPSEAGLRVGAAVSLSDAYQALVDPYPEVAEIWERFASPPIRNAGTLGGNVANGSPIGDSMPWLIAVGARVVLRNRERARTLPIEDLYLGYMKKSMRPDEILEAIEVPLPAQDQRFRTYKLSKRYDSDISAVCAAFSVRLDGFQIREPRVAFGGMAATPKRAPNCEAALAGQSWSEASVRVAMAALALDYAPLDDMRASAGYRRQTAANLLYRFYLETRPEHPLDARSVSVFAYT